MAVYLGENRIKINLNGIVYILNLFTTAPILNGIRLLTSENYVIRDSNGLYITVKEDE